MFVPSLLVAPSQAQDQISMKPSVARRLNDRIRTLEAELGTLRDASRVTELEKKVQVRVCGCISCMGNTGLPASLVVTLEKQVRVPAPTIA